MLALVFMAFLPLAWLLGNALITVLDAKRSAREWHLEDRVVAGILVLIGLAEGAYLAAMTRGQSVSAFTKYYGILLIAAGVVCGLIGLIFAWIGKKHGQAGTQGLNISKFKNVERKEWIVILLFLVMVLTQVFLILLRTCVFLEYDETLETVVSFLQTDRFYEVNPLTGQSYEQGMPMRLKILCLPALLTFLTKITQADPELVTWHVFPVITLLGAYLAYASLARILFPEKRFHRCLFLLIVALLVFVSDCAYGAEGFGLLHGGFQGTAIRGAVMMPWVFGLCIRRKWRLVPLVILAEACLVWTLYGLGMSALVTVTFLAYLGLKNMLQRRKEGRQCLNS